MLALEIYKLTHPQSLSDIELKEILEERCIDFSDYKNLSRCELIELYQRVAMPLPQRQTENNQNLDVNRGNEKTNSMNESWNESVLVNGTNNEKLNVNEITKTSHFTNTESTNSIGKETKCTAKKICVSSSITKYNGSDKRNSEEKFDGAPSKKRQKITWP